MIEEDEDEEEMLQRALAASAPPPPEPHGDDSDLPGSSDDDEDDDLDAALDDDDPLAFELREDMDFGLERFDEDDRGKKNLLPKSNDEEESRPCPDANVMKAQKRQKKEEVASQSR